MTFPAAGIGEMGILRRPSSSGRKNVKDDGAGDVREEEYGVIEKKFPAVRKRSYMTAESPAASV
jgi:hypothetical protein